MRIDAAKLDAWHRKLTSAISGPIDDDDREDLRELEQEIFKAWLDAVHDEARKGAA